MFNKHPKSSGIYHIKDNINELQFRVYFKQIQSLLKLPKFELRKNSAKKGFIIRNDIQDINDETVQITKIKWQQKLLNPNEIEIYKDAQNCITPIQKEYHQRLLNEIESDVNSNDETVNTLRKRKSRPTKRKNKLKKERKSHQSLLPILSKNCIFTYINEDCQAKDEQAETTDVKNRRKLLGPVTVMHVCAAIKPEIILITLKWYVEQKLLYVYPDFNDFISKPYNMEIDTDYRRMFAFGIENISSLRLNINKAENDIIQYLPLHELTTIHSHADEKLRAKFLILPKMFRRITLLFEIREGYGFARDNLYIRYRIELPSNAMLEDGLLNSSTHSSWRMRNIHHYGHTWQLTLLLEEDNNDSANFLRIYFEILPNDSWTHQNIEGCAYYVTSLEAANEENIELQCIRPIDSLTDVICRFFKGGRTKFDYMNFFRNHNENNINLHMEKNIECTGYINLKCQRLIQKHCDLLRPCKSLENGMTLDDIMQAYREARKRVENVFKLKEM